MFNDDKIKKVQSLTESANNITNTNVSPQSMRYFAEANGGGSGGTYDDVCEKFPDSGQCAIKQVTDNFGTECPADSACYGDYNGDGVVNVDDLLWVLEHWDEFDDPPPSDDPEGAPVPPSFASISNQLAQKGIKIGTSG